MEKDRLFVELSKNIYGLNEMNERFQQLEGDVKEMKEAFLRLVNHMTQE